MGQTESLTLQNYAILINTCDKFDDCWDPFFKLWSLYWRNCSGKVYLNTEYKNYHYAGMDIIPLKVCETRHISKDQRVAWSQCLKWALEDIKSDIILYMQEDYFLNESVKNNIVEKYVQLMTENKDINCIHLTDQSIRAESKSKYEHLDRAALHQRYRVSCQAALWRKSELLELIREYEDAWEFEEFGSKRSAVLNREYYVVNRNFVQLKEFEIIPYIFTGIIQGRWYEEVVPLFEKQGIVVDFAKRGFVKSAPPKPLLTRIKYRLNKIPKIIRNRIDLYSLKRSVK